MQTFNINFNVPQGWYEISDKQLRYAFEFITKGFTSDWIKVLCLFIGRGCRNAISFVFGFILRGGLF